MPPLDAVTGAFGYTGRHIAERLLTSGRSVRTLTGHPDRPDALREQIEVRPLNFDAIDQLTQDLRGVDTLYCTYWVRFARGGLDHLRAVENLKRLFSAAERAGVRRVVHVSITGASSDSPLPYFRGKGLVEEALHQSRLPHGIVRPALIFGDEDILLHNIAWIVRRLPFFPIFGDGTYRVQPIHVDDLAGLAMQLGNEAETRTVDAVGPETYTFTALVERIAQAVGRHPKLVHISPDVGVALGRIGNIVTRDVLITRDEIRGLMADLLVSHAPPTAPTALGAWLDAHHTTLGVHYVSEVQRHFDRPGRRS